jgi:hypothetical protein
MESEARLSLPSSSFIGRQTDLERVRQLLGSGVRLVTLTGPGGVGKTRLALECAAQNAHAFADGVFFVSLQALTEPQQVLEEVASVQHLVRSLSLARGVGDTVATRNALNGLGTNAYLKHDHTTALAHFQASLVLDRELADRWGVAKRLNGIGNVLLKQRDFDNALVYVQQSLTMIG